MDAAESSAAIACRTIGGREFDQVSSTPIEVIVPVYNAYAALKECLNSLRKTLSPDQPLILIDDASTDPRVRPLLERFGRRPGTRVLWVKRNQGFVRTANQAMALGRSDIVLLNTDTIVTQGWLQRLVRCADSDPGIATITPFSNNAEICSFPKFCVANPVPDDPEHIAGLMSSTGQPGYPEIPTAVGFCMYIRRSVLDQIGLFDAATFGWGYGEENDFCMRAKAAGYRNVLCDDAYVVHLGNQSFAELGLQPGGENLQRLLQRYPHYNELIADFIQRDPLRARRDELIRAIRRA